eukprot:6210152-Pleurochrysis_carterae.AAC.2
MMRLVMRSSAPSLCLATPRPQPQSRHSAAFDAESARLEGIEQWGLAREEVRFKIISVPSRNTPASMLSRARAYASVGACATTCARACAVAQSFVHCFRDTCERTRSLRCQPSWVLHIQHMGRHPPACARAHHLAA